MARRDLLELVQGDITGQPDLEAIVNAANAELRPGGGVAGAIHRAAGPGLDEACRPLAPIAPGQAVLTPGFDLPNEHVIHALGPRYGIDEPAEDLLARAYQAALALCADHRIATVGFPALSAGAFGFPLERAAAIALETIHDHAPAGLRVRFILFDETTLEAFRALAPKAG